MDLLNDLIESTYNNTRDFSMRGTRIQAKVLRVYDGDTLYLCAPQYGRLHKFNCRMLGYDSPELKQNQNHCFEARNALVLETANIKGVELDSTISNKELNIILDSNTKVIEAEFKGKDKYGRELVRLYDESGCINERMIHKYGFNIPYDGKSKRPVHE